MNAIAARSSKAEAQQAPPADANASSSPPITAAAARLHAAAGSLPGPGPAFVDASVSPEFRSETQEVRERAVKLLERLQKVRKEGERRRREKKKKKACRFVVRRSQPPQPRPPPPPPKNRPPLPPALSSATTLAQPGTPWRAC